MFKNAKQIIIVLFSVSVFLGCTHSDIQANTDISKPASTKQQYQGYMGFTPWPSDLTEQAVLQTYKFINENANIVSHHFDNGIPWQEAYDKKPLPQHLQKDWAKRLSLTPKEHKILLSITPIDFERKDLALYWGNETDGQPLPSAWQDKNFNDPDIKTAYANYALMAIQAFQPDFLAIGIESNALLSHAPEKWAAYLELNADTYTKIKAVYPNLPVFSTVQYEHLRGIEEVSKDNLHLQKKGVKQLMEHSDYMALSTYRYGFIHPNPPTEDYFDLARSFGKPVAVAETGAMSESSVVMGLPLLSNEKTQDNFIGMILKNAYMHNFPFVINWVPRDFDPMLKKLPKEIRKIAKLWANTGIVTSKGKPKKVYKTWHRYLVK